MLRKFKSWFDRTTPDELSFKPQTITVRNKEYLLRRMTEDDVDAALAIERRIYHDTPWDRYAFFSELRKVRHSLYLAVEDAGQLVALIGTWFTLSEAHVTNIAVDPAYQHMGLGRFLMQFMIGRAIDYGSQKMTLEVRTNNDIAKHLYRSLGFQDGKIKKVIMSAITMMHSICIGHCRNRSLSSL
ncbi:ribosomal-protein-S18p-alanine acetyltransferase [Lacticaseibacillus paracasei]|nr:ribosomal-protein-S18p-alanine acetyltransferase [Lacticaseibacillus paracasei]EKQ05648.1 ribosomal-protein-S18p-alanine acetyltransferase [Lacticaseibacillus paracasei]EKQ17419.1 ribosomal-protein-S18p-alanine acetyltransferase [Lacticaseibacillus paracasei]EPC23080.1 Ribosomal-protein-S18p-alanineacetyltransferase [Lacticaseibacillus paracasei subsp. paracasei Lpp17]